MLSIISGEENYKDALADPCYRRSDCMANSRIYKMAERSNVFASFYRFSWWFYIATCIFCIVASKMDSGNTHSSYNHSWNSLFQRQAHSGLKGPITRSLSLVCTSMQKTESKVSKSCFTFPYIQRDRSRLIAKIGHLIDQLAINI